jgi:hypothetical protein
VSSLSSLATADNVAAAFCLLAFAAFVAFVASFLPPLSSFKTFWEVWTKYASEFVQLGCVLAGGWGTYRVAAEDKGEWWQVVASALVAGFCWKVLQVTADLRNRSATKNLKAEADRAERELDRQTRLLTVLGEAVAEKITRVNRSLDDLGMKQRTIAAAREALTPQPHLESLLNTLAALLQEQARSAGVANPIFRVGVYVACGGVMRPLHGIDTHHPGYNPFTSFNLHSQSFQVGGDGPRAHAVLCVRQRVLLIVEDCEAEASAGRFIFFNEGQRSYLRSLVAYYLGQVRGEDGTLNEGALVIDTPIAGFFRESERDALTFRLGEAARRITLELALVALLTN